LPHVVRRRWLHQELIPEPPCALSRDDAEGWLPRLRLSKRETHPRHADLLRRLRPDERRLPMCAVFLVPGRQPSHLRCLTGEWRDHRRHCEPEGLAHSRNEVDQNFLRADSDDRNPFDLMNPIVDLSPNYRCHLVTACCRRSDGQNSQSLSDSMDGPSRDQLHPMQIRPWIHLWNHPWPVRPSPLGDRRLEGRLTCPSATNWKKKDWPWAQPTGPRPQP